MRILVDAFPVVDGGGGICTYFLGLLAGWNAAGFDDEWHILGTRSLPESVDKLVGAKGTVQRIGNAAAFNRVVMQHVTLPRRSRQSSPWKPDVLLATTPVIPLLPLRIPIVAMVHDLRYLQFPREFGAFSRFYRRLVYRHGLRHADGLLTNSDFTRREVMAEVGNRQIGPQVAHLGCDHVDQWREMFSPGDHAITFAHWSNKRPDLAVRAWALVAARQPDFHTRLHVAGCSPPTAEALLALANELGVSHLLQLHGFLAEADYWRLFASASLVLVPSTMEGFGLPVLEAQRLGIPVVAMAVGAIREIGGDAPLYSSDGSVETFAKLCEEALLDPGRREAAIARGLRHAEGFTWRRTAELTRGELARAAEANAGRDH
jgi:glycosyltransferase involved in cell wall biosynthesis